MTAEACSHHSITIIFLVIVGASLGTHASLLVNLTRDCDYNVICATDTVTYTCTADAAQVVQVQWIAEPFIGAAEPLRIVLNNPNNLDRGTQVGPFVIQLTSLDPFVTELVISGNLINSSIDIMCLTVGSNADGDSLLHMADREVEPVGIMNAEGMNGDFDDGFFMVNFEPSPSLDITKCIVNCTGNTCLESEISGNETSAVMMADGDIGGDRHNVCVCCLNRCGMESPMRCTVVKVKTDPAFAALVFLFPITAVALLVVTAAFIVYVVYVQVYRKKYENEEDSTELRSKVEPK